MFSKKITMQQKYLFVFIFYNIPYVFSINSLYNSIAYMFCTVTPPYHGYHYQVTEMFMASYVAHTLQKFS